MKTTSQQLNYFIAFLFTLSILVVANYLQFYKGINPCPLCILQRFTIGILGLLFLLGIGFAVKKFSRLSLGIFSFIVSSLGIVLAGRQVWLQHLPPSTNANCEASLEYMLKVLPFD